MEVDLIFERKRVYNEAQGINGFALMAASFEQLLPVDKNTMEHMNYCVKAAFEQLLPWADQSLLLVCSSSWTHSTPLLCYMLKEANACTNEYINESESDASIDSDGEEHCVKLWYYKDDHPFLKDEFTDRVYDFDTQIEIGIYVGGEDDVIDFYENEENSRRSSECSDTSE